MFIWRIITYHENDASKYEKTQLNEINKFYLVVEIIITYCSWNFSVSIYMIFNVSL